MFHGEHESLRGHTFSYEVHVAKMVTKPSEKNFHPWLTRALALYSYGIFFFSHFSIA